MSSIFPVVWVICYFQKPLCYVLALTNWSSLIKKMYGHSEALSNLLKIIIIKRKTFLKILIFNIGSSNLTTDVLKIKLWNLTQSITDSQLGSTFGSEFTVINEYCCGSLLQGSIAIYCNINNDYHVLGTAVDPTGFWMACSLSVCILLPWLFKKSTDIILSKMIGVWYVRTDFCFSEMNISLLCWLKW